MNPLTLTKMALHSLWVNKGRSILTMLGVIIGVSAVSLLVAIGNGLQALVATQFESFGANNIYISPGNPFGESGRGFNPENQRAALINNKIEYREVQAVRRVREWVKAASALTQGSAQASYKKTVKRPTVVGVDPEYQEITQTFAEKGRFFTNNENQNRKRVAALGPKIAEELFGSIDPIGKTILLNSQRYKVVGVLEEKGGGFGGPSFDNYVFIPVQTSFKLFDSTKVTQIIAQSKNEAEIPATIKAIENALSARLDEDEFSVYEQTQILDVINQILSGLTAGLGGIAAISLVVGGIGIMNIMLVSVTERTREIGLRKALGATPNLILLQFLIEAVVLSFFGGFIGVMLAFIGSLAIGSFIPAKLSLFGIGLAFGVSVIVGVVFGVYPARKASQLSPIEALRYE